LDDPRVLETALSDGPHTFLRAQPHPLAVDEVQFGGDRLVRASAGSATGSVPHHHDGRHRRVELADLLAYANRRSEEQYAAINEMVDIGYQSDQHILCSTPDVASLGGR